MRALIASSATGGHIYPALAIAEGIKKRDPGAAVLFVGAKWEIGKELVERAGYEQVFIDARGFDRKNPLNNIAALCALARSSGEIKKILRGFRPDAVIGTGGHVAGPVIRLARRAGIRTFIQEQNVIPGMANKLAEKYADRVFIGFEAAAAHFKEKGKLIVSGNPVRAAFAEAAAERDRLREKYGVAASDVCVLIFGGSQGADAINDAAVDAIGRLGGMPGFRFFFITGPQLYGQIRKTLTERFSEDPAGLAVMGYADAIYELYAAADLIVSRAGALTVTEIAASGKASILVPSPNVTNNHQYYNAKALADAGAAVILSEGEIRGGGLASEIERLAEDPETSDAMGRAAHGLAKPDAVKAIVDEIFGN
ncbi:MAG: undecaprenyldiphospho-muramoylpentapeptide beta-N-acetylglucosaminyltransferase [Clostridiales Family XIII bacterium]|jgi:UDP-N-acetylglucosamine--N-acetylmuramyl-(pentapeptide) pyrophosphoryl-undecaprenol N-acetylglucosamine transferase|nr:undecaprenyldiphospho-muramoylpentapeptide beta-N-acetylglucosaminyltransferase [Clostridiales Family XIII bacterium]